MTRILKKDIAGLTFCGKPIKWLHDGNWFVATDLTPRVSLALIMGTGRQKWRAKLKYVLAPGGIVSIAADGGSPSASLKRLERSATKVFEQLGEALGYEVTS